MKRANWKKCAGMIAACFLILSLSACGTKPSMSAELNDETGGYEVIADRVQDSSTTGNITIAEGECLAVSPTLKEGYIIISLCKDAEFEGDMEDGPADTLTEAASGNQEKAVLREKITGNDMSVYPLDSGDYYISFIVEEEKTSGTMNVMPFSIAELREQNAELAKTLGEADSGDADTAVAADAAKEAADNEAAVDADTAAAADTAEEAAGDAGSTGEAAAEDEDGQNPVMNFIGPYGYYRAGMEISAQGRHNAQAVVTWASSAWEYSEWTMSGPFDEETLTITYTDCVKKNYTYNENGEIASETVAYENGSGTITFRDGPELSLTWKDDQENIADDAVFTWSFVPPEE